MRLVRILLLVFAVSHCLSVSLKAQSEPSLASRIIRQLKIKEPNWYVFEAINNTPVPLVPIETRIFVGGWQKPRSEGPSEVVNVFIYAVENRADAAEWLKPVRNGQVPAGWKTDHVHVGDEGFLAKYKKGERFEIQFRKGKVVVKVGANDLSTVTEFAGYIVEQLPTN